MHDRGELTEYIWHFPDEFKETFTQSAVRRSPLLVFRILDLQQNYGAFYLVNYALTV